MLYSPINYQGNKSRIVDELLRYIPQNIRTIHEIFCGSAILALASNIKKIFLNDIDHYILDLIKYFQSNTAEKIIQQTDCLISKYGLTNTFYEGRNKYIEEKHEGLSRYNKEAFNKLKNDYNNDKDIAKLFVLTIYGFNHFLRFNGNDQYNVPVGKVDFVESLRKRTAEYCKAIQSKNLIITNCDFRDSSLYTTTQKDELYYFDPPYLITQAPYNLCWNEQDEKDLLSLLDNINERGGKFLLSNVIRSNGKENHLLIEWMKKYNVKHIKRRYLNSNYQKKNLSEADEVIIFNYSEDEMSNLDTGRSGNRKGYKIFSINTTVRNPKRNLEFLTHFVPYADKEFDEDLSYQYFFDLVTDGVYRLTDIPEHVKKKINDGEKLTVSEAREAIKNNPQATGLHGRVMTQLRSLKDQGFLIFKNVKRGVNKISITQLGKELIDGKTDATLIYTKAMIGMHAHSPIRVKLLNEARPFLNTIFVINEVKKQWTALGNEAKGILRHEFAAFVLSMKDCDYKKATTEIINEYFTQTIKWENGIFEFKGLSFGIIYVYPLFTKPAICRKNYDCEDKKYSLRDSDIYFRYSGRSERIKSSDLEKIIDERRKNEEKQWLSFIEKAAKIGIQNASLINLDKCEINEAKGKIVIDKELIQQIKFIKEGEFSEKEGAPTLRLIGNIQEIETGRLVITEPKKIIKAIEHSDIIYSFLKQEEISSPENYIKHICSGFSGKYPVYYYIYKAKISVNQAIKIVEASTSRYSGKKGLLKRLMGDTLHRQIVKKADTELSKLKLKYIDLWANQNINPLEKELRGCISAIMYLTQDVIETHKKYILDTMHELFNKHYEHANGQLAADFRNSIAYLDEIIFKDKCIKE